MKKRTAIKPTDFRADLIGNLHERQLAYGVNYPDCSDIKNSVGFIHDEEKMPIPATKCWLHKVGSIEYKVYYYVLDTHVYLLMPDAEIFNKGTWESLCELANLHFAITKKELKIIDYNEI